jgi:hypothetical protein
VIDQYQVKGFITPPVWCPPADSARPRGSLANRGHDVAADQRSPTPRGERQLHPSAVGSDIPLDVGGDWLPRIRPGWLRFMRLPRHVLNEESILSGASGPISIAADLAMPLGQTDPQALYLRTSFRILYS